MEESLAALAELPAGALLLSLAQLPAFVTLLDRAGRFVWCSHFGYGYGSELIGTDAAMTVVEEDRPAWRQAVARCFSLRDVMRYCVRSPTPVPGGVARMAGRMAPVVIDGKVVYVAAVTYDVTDMDGAPCPACGRPPAGGVAVPAPAGGVAMFSPLSLAVLRALDGAGWVPTSALALAVGGHSDLRANLRGLSARGAVELAPRKGVRITPAGSAALQSLPPADM